MESGRNFNGHRGVDFVKNILSIEEQIYLIYYWCRTNLKNFEPTQENIKKAIFDEFAISDQKVINEIYGLFHD